MIACGRAQRAPTFPLLKVVGMNRIDPCQLNAAIAAITNQLYCSLSKNDFINLGIFLSMLSKGILSMAAIEEFLKWEHRDDRFERMRRETEKRREEERLMAEETLAEEENLTEETLLAEESEEASKADGQD